MARCFSTITQTAGASARLFLVFQNISSVINTYYSPFGIILLLILITVIGIIAAVAKDFFNSDVTMEVVNQLEELERTGKKEHVVFLVSEQPRARASKGPITETPRSPVGRRNAEVSQGKNLKIPMRSLECQPCSLCIHRRLSQRGPPSAKAEVTGK